MAIAGTSMSSPHAAGVSALVKAAHPHVDPGTDQVGAHDLLGPERRQGGRLTPADPFDRGAGSIRADRAVDAPITFDVPAEDYIAAVQAIRCTASTSTTPSIDATTMPGEIETTRTMKNVTGRRLVVRESTPGAARVGDRRHAAAGRARAQPVRDGDDRDPGQGARPGTNKQYFGQVTFHANGHGLPDRCCRWRSSRSRARSR